MKEHSLQLPEDYVIQFLSYSFHVGKMGSLLRSRDEWTCQLKGYLTGAVSRVFIVICVCVCVCVCSNASAGQTRVLWLTSAIREPQI
jgi:hypothetical protein